MPIILDTSPEAAQFVDHISGWVSRDGHYFGNNKTSEQAARYAGCTHTLCQDCQQPAPKEYTFCDLCRNKRADERYTKREQVVWDETGMLYSEAADHYFSAWDEVYDFADDNAPGPVDLRSLRLLICEPVYLSTLEDDYWLDDFPEDTELPADVQTALQEFNAVLKAAGPVSWRPGEKAVLLQEAPAA